MQAQRQHGRIVSIALRPAVPTAIVRIAVLVVVLAVESFVMTLVADQIERQGETIVGGDEIDAGVRAAAIVLVQIGGSWSR